MKFLIYLADIRVLCQWNGEKINGYKILFQDEGWKLNRTNYYQEGWLATGNVRGIVGVTFTTSHCKKAVDFPLRTNYNLRGHRSEVSEWNYSVHRSEYM